MLTQKELFYDSSQECIDRNTQYLFLVFYTTCMETINKVHAFIKKCLSNLIIVDIVNKFNCRIVKALSNS